MGLRWWNEVDPQSGQSHWVFESSEPGTKIISATDSRFFWLAIYAQPLLWIVLAVLAMVRFKVIWLPLVGMWLASIFPLADFFHWHYVCRVVPLNVLFFFFS